MERCGFNQAAYGNRKNNIKLDKSLLKEINYSCKEKINDNLKIFANTSMNIWKSMFADNKALKWKKGDNVKYIVKKL